MAKRKKELTQNQLDLEKDVQKQMTEIYNNQDKKVSTTRNLRKLLPFYMKYKARFFTLVGLLIGSILFGFLNPIISAEIVGFLTALNFDMAIKWTIIYVLFEILLQVLRCIIGVVETRLNFNIRIDMRHTLMDSINRMSMDKMDELNSNVLIARINSDSSKCASSIFGVIKHLLNMFSSIGFFIYIAFINIYFFLIMLVYVVIKYFIDDNRIKTLLKHNKISSKRIDTALNGYHEQIRGIKDVKSLHLRDNMQAVVKEKLEYVHDEDYKANKKWYMNSHLISGPLDCIVELLIVVAGVLLIKHNIISFAEFFVVYMYRYRAQHVTNYFVQLKDKLSEGELAAERYFDVVERFKKETFGNVEKQITVGDIEFKNVYFDYNENAKVLKGINFKVQPNKTTAIVGKSGGGKSTLLSLLGKMYVPTKGKILFDGTDINTLTENSLRNAIGIVNQMPYIFNTSIRNNMKYVKPDVTDEEIWEVLRMAQIEKDIRALPEGLDSTIGENGVKVSGGQRQRLAIARVLLKKNKILVFDEATSALDNTSQAKIVKELDKLKKDHTILVVAHRLSTIVDADNIVVLDNGKVAAEGTHTQLLKTCPIYQELYLEEENDNKE